MANSGLLERRFRVAGSSLTPECRLCWRTVVLEPEYVEATEQHVYVRCPHCTGSFPIRHSDVATFPWHEASAG